MQRDIDLRKTKGIYIDMEELPNNCIIIVGDLKAKIRSLPQFGEYRVVVHQGKIKRMNTSEGEEF